ncbi:MAG: ABC transporter permease [Clostridia bacterium]|nr:ABC transporter permease [Clostridia bacterium]
MFRGFKDHKIEKLGKGFEETDQLEELKRQPSPDDDTVFCDDGTTPITEDLFTEAEYNAEEAERSGYSNYSYWGSTLRVFLKKKISVILLVFLVVLLLFTFVQPLLPNQKDPLKIHTTVVTDSQGFSKEENLRNVQPNKEFWFGTNSIGQDLWSRIWRGTRTSLFIGLCVAITNNIIGIVLGSIWGYARKMDWLFTEIYNLFDNIPYTILRMLLLYIMRPSLKTMIFVMCLTGWIGMSKYIRNQILIYRDREYNLASRCLGTPSLRIILKNILPQLVSVIMLQTALAIPDAIGSEVFLTYIGLGLPISLPSLGNLINEGRKVMLVPSQRYQLIFPVIVVAAITISFYALGNAFADASDPRNHR